MAAEHTPAVEPGATAAGRPGRAAPPATILGAPIIERKAKPGGIVKEYPCTLVHRARGVTVVRFVMTRGGVLPLDGEQLEVQPLGISDGYFWDRRPYNLYRMRAPDGRILAHRFDAVTEVRFTGATLDYRDLVLDWWALPDGRLVAEDEDELEALQAAGAISAADVARAQAAARAVTSRYRHIIDEAAAIERRFEE